MKILFINSKGHWMNGSFTKLSMQQIAIQTIRKAGIQIDAVEVSSAKELLNELTNASANTLVWANAYWVGEQEGEMVNLIETVGKYDLPLVGSNYKTLLQLIEKDNCQIKLNQSGIPIPTNIIIDRNESDNWQYADESYNLRFPLVVKPTKEARSLGVKMVYNAAETTEAVQQISINFPESNIIIEEFLPTQDITCGFLRMGDQEMLLPSYNVVEGLNCETGIFSHYHSSLPNGYEQQICIEDPSILEQLAKHVPAIVSLFNIQSATRIDGRLDKDGIMNFFDINGMPGLNFPGSFLNNQCFSYFPEYSKEHLFDCLMHTIIADSLLRYNMNVPAVLEDNNMFNLETSKLSILRAKSIV